LELGAKDFVKKYSNNFKNNFLRYSKQGVDINKMNLIKLILKVDENQLNQEVFFLDNYICMDNDKKSLPHNHLKELNEKNVELKINGENAKFSKSFKPKKCENEIIIEFKTPLKDCSYMFYGCNCLVYIDLSLFNTKYVTNMECMFAFCSNLDRIDLSFLDTKKVKSMEKMFFYCSNLEQIKLNQHLGNIKINMESIFYGCSRFKTLDLSFLKADDEFDIDSFSKMNKNLETIIINKECKDKFKNCSFNIKYV
jgi:surface protein